MPAALVFPDIDPILIHVWGPIAIRWYSLAYIAGILVGWWMIVRMLRERALWKNPPFNGTPPATADDIGDLVVWATVGILVGGRLGWVIFYGTILCSFSPNAGFCHGLPMGFVTNPIRIISAWDGGMSFHGGLIGMVIALILFARSHKIDVIRLGDLVSAIAPIGLFFGRIANFINGELWGRPTDVPWAMVFCNQRILSAYRGRCPAGWEPRHPSQLYEAALEGIALFVILQIGMRVFRWHERPGLVTAVFLAGYGLFRIFVEFFREPDAPFLGPVSMGQALSLFMWGAAIFFFWYALRQRRAAASA